MSLNIEKVIKLLPSIPPKVVIFFVSYTEFFIAYCKATNKICTTKTLVDFLPKFILESFGYLAELYLEKNSIFYYEELGEVVDCLVNLEQSGVNYSSEDSKEDFKKKESIIFDVLENKKDYIKNLEKKLTLGKNENSSNPYE